MALTHLKDDLIPIHFNGSFHNNGLSVVSECILDRICVRELDIENEVPEHLVKQSTIHLREVKQIPHKVDIPILSTYIGNIHIAVVIPPFSKIEGFPYTKVRCRGLNHILPCRDKIPISHNIAQSSSVRRIDQAGGNIVIRTVCRLLINILRKHQISDDSVSRV